jgi:arsenate reductase (glutaredoxin)
MKKIYHLNSCTTCQAILEETGLDKKEFEMQDIKFEKITPSQLDHLKQNAGSYEALFSRRALKYKELGLKNRKLEENDYRKLILDEYTFLKRPVIIINAKLFAGSEKKTREALKKAIKALTRYQRGYTDAEK